MGQICSSVFNKLQRSSSSVSIIEEVAPSPSALNDQRNPEVTQGNEGFQVDEQCCNFIATAEDNRCIPSMHESPIAQPLLTDLTNILPAGNRTLSEFVTVRPALKSYRERSDSLSSEKGLKKIKVDDYLPFPILKHQISIQFVKNSKTLVIMRGLSGSGKSHIVSKLRMTYGDLVTHCSADLYFMQGDGKYALFASKLHILETVEENLYKFDSNLLKEAHSFCREQAEAAMISSCPIVIIDNTNIKFWEYKDYVTIAKKYRYLVLILVPQTPWAWNSEELEMRNSHGVPREVLQNKIMQYQPSLPIYFGWFLNEADSIVLIKKAFQFLNVIIGIAEYLNSLVFYCERTAPDSMRGGIKCLPSYFKQCGPNDGFDLLHCTSFFAAKGKSCGYSEYVASLGPMGQISHLLVSGFVITPRTIGVRIVLPDDCLPMWLNDENLPPAVVTKMSQAVREAGAPPELTGGMHDLASNILDRLLPSLPCEDSRIGASSVRPVSMEEARKLCRENNGSRIELSRLTPFRSVGYKAHLTVAHGSGVPPVATGFDIMDVVNMETDEHLLAAGSSDNCTKNINGHVEGDMLTSADGGRQLRDVAGGTVADFGEGVFAFYLNEWLSVPAMFTAFY